MDEHRRRHFLTDVIDADLHQGRHGGKVLTRFPPEPNGFLHIGHAKAICLNFGLARDYGGRCHLRFDDTNPLKEEQRYVDAICADVQWLGFAWDGPVRFGSDLFAEMVEVATHLVRRGLAYVDDQSVEEIRERRGAFDRPGVDSPFRDRSVEENLRLFREMQRGVHPDGAKVLRARVDMAHPNMIMRDPLLYRIRHAHHHRTGDRYCIYPMYDFAHCLEDAFEGVTHSICTLEFESNRELYDWVLDAVADIYHWNPRPRQYEFARLQVGYTVMSKRKFLRLVEEGHVEGWDDPRMPTLAGMRRRGYTPESIRDFAELVGISKHNSFVDVGKLEHCVRKDLEGRCPRALAVLDPLPLTVTGLPADAPSALTLPWWPGEPERAGSRAVPFSAALLVEREDYEQPAPAGWKRMSLGARVRLFGACVIQVDGEVRDADGQLVGLRASALPETLGGAGPADGGAVAGVVHWLDATHAVKAEVRLYDRMVRVEQPEAGGADFLEALNPDSLRIATDARVEPALAQAPAGHRVQFLRLGYFCVDPATGADGTVRWNRIITLRDAWARAHGDDADDGRPERADHRATPQRTAAEAKALRDLHRATAHASDPALAARYAALVGAGVEEQDADLIAADGGLHAALQAGLAVHADAVALCRWLRNEVRGHLGERALGPAEAVSLGQRIGRLVALVEAGALTTTAAKRVAAEIVATGREPAAIIDELGLQRQGEDATASAVAAVVAAHPAEVARYRAGDVKLLAFFIGKAMAQLRGTGDAATVRSQLQRALA